MKRNEGNTDRIVRIILAIAFFVGALATQLWLVAVPGVILGVTGLVGWCPLYTLFGFSTCPVKSPSQS